jgi:hypothetical protein
MKTDPKNPASVQSHNGPEPSGDTLKRKIPPYVRPAEDDEIRGQEADSGHRKGIQADLDDVFAGHDGTQEKTPPKFAGNLNMDFEVGRDDSREDFVNFNEYPKPNPAAFHGVTGDLTLAIKPHTEADPMAIQTQLLIACGCAIGHGPHLHVGATKHFTNLHACLVGRTSKGRKGSALDFVILIMRQVDNQWTSTCMTSGLSSGEGLIYAVRNPLIKKEQVKKGGKYTDEIQEQIVDFGVDDKRLFVTETEFSRPLKAMSRENNILSEIIRLAWDHGNLRSIVKNSPYQAHDAHIAIVGHVTGEELYAGLTECHFFNGFANRFLWLCVQRSNILPFGGDFALAEVMNEINQLKDTIEWARGVEEMERDDDANQLWESEYEDLSADLPGRFGAAIGRGEGQALRLSMLYALLDKSRIIKLVHLKAALALWQYCVDSARHLFLTTLENPNAAKIFAALRQKPNGMTRNEISVTVFQRHLSRVKIDEALKYLRCLGFARCVMQETAGRSAERWSAISKEKNGDEEYD